MAAATAVLVGPDQLASLHALLLEAAAILGMEPPDLYIRQVLAPHLLAPPLTWRSGGRCHAHVAVICVT